MLSTLCHSSHLQYISNTGQSVWTALFREASAWRLYSTSYVQALPPCWFHLEPAAIGAVEDQPSLSSGKASRWDLYAAVDLDPLPASPTEGLWSSGSTGLLDTRTQCAISSLLPPLIFWRYEVQPSASSA